MPERGGTADALAQAGVAIETSCFTGLCETCKVRPLEGDESSITTSFRAKRRKADT
jgi:ferredoxin